MSPSETIGEKIKEIRTSKNITLKQLSESTGLSTGLLSQLERGISSIAIDSLENISSALGITLSSFFADQPSDSNEPIIYSFDHKYSQIAPKIFQTILSHDPASFKMLPRLTQLMPQTSSKEEEIEMYSHDGEEFIYVLEGTITLLLDDRKQVLNPGDCVQFKSFVNHNWINDTNKVVKLLTVNTPSPLYQNSTKESVPLL
ncbi:MAG TPA: XRE family transcriptional regulator [Candidatus Dorea intestinavium]|nr:XRE family transcriptional regulator [Candidatus Dorea intestinavium]